MCAPSSDRPEGFYSWYGKVSVTAEVIDRPFDISCQEPIRMCKLVCLQARVAGQIT
jgi:hypothetical protein